MRAPAANALAGKPAPFRGRFPSHRLLLAIQPSVGSAASEPSIDGDARRRAAQPWTALAWTGILP